MPVQPMAETIDQIQMADYYDARAPTPSPKPSPNGHNQESHLTDAKRTDNKLKQHDREVLKLKIKTAKLTSKLKVQQNVMRARSAYQHRRRTVMAFTERKRDHVRRRNIRNVARSAASASGNISGMSGRGEVALDMLVKMTPTIPAFGRWVNGQGMGVRFGDAVAAGGDVGMGGEVVQERRSEVTEEGDGVERVVRLLGETQIGDSV